MIKFFLVLALVAGGALYVCLAVWAAYTAGRWVEEWSGSPGLGLLTYVVLCITTVFGVPFAAVFAFGAD